MQRGKQEQAQNWGRGKCFVAVIPWPPGPTVNTKQGRKTPNWLDVSSSSEERVIQEDQNASHSQCEAKQSWPQLLPHFQVKPWDRQPLRSYRGAGEKREAHFAHVKLWLKRERENLPKAETEESAILLQMEKGNFPFAREHPDKGVILALEELRQQRE